MIKINANHKFNLPQFNISKIKFESALNQAQKEIDPDNKTSLKGRGHGDRFALKTSIVKQLNLENINHENVYIGKSRYYSNKTFIDLKVMIRALELLEVDEKTLWFQFT